MPMQAIRASRTLKLSEGFTIVELLIVIVVIAILAAITIVSYTGIQESARNSQYVSDARNAYNLLLAYHTKNGAYPAITNGGNSVCIGTGFTSYVGDSNGDCWDTKSSVYRSVDPAFNTALFTAGTLGSGTKQGIFYRTGPDVEFTGPVFITPAETSQPTGKYGVRFWVTGTTCPTGTKTWSSSAGFPVSSACTIDLPTP